MKILLINGSPKGKNSNSLKLANSFIEGIRQTKASAGEELIVDEAELASLKIASCKGCFSCWKNTPGKCCIPDDMPMVIQKMLSSDLIVWSFQLYYFNVPGILKNLIDRQLPMSLPFMSKDGGSTGSGGHDARFDMSGIRHVLISTCGFYSAEGNYDSVRAMFDHFLGKDNYTTIFCGQGELFRVKELSERTGEYLNLVKKAGAEYAAGRVSEATEGALKELLYPRDVFEKMADASWGVSQESGEKVSEDLIFTRQMAALYNKASYEGKDRVLEMHYTDLGTSYQILLGKDGSTVVTDGSLTTTTRIDTPFDVWVSISRGEMSGQEALGKGLYSVTGDFSLMMYWGRYFGGSGASTGGSAPSASGKKELKNPSMASMLIPWIAFWIATSMFGITGAAVSILIAAATPVIMLRRRQVIWDRLATASVCVLSVLIILGADPHMIGSLGYLVFAAMWLGSCVAKRPLCSAYVKYQFGGDIAYKNPLFMKTNYILATMWGILYVLTAIWSTLLGRAGLGWLLMIINNLVPMGMGIFTAFFSKWYPAYLASGKGKSKL